MKKPTHKPPQTSPAKPDPKLVLFALNILIESEKAKSLPPELLQWIKKELIDAAFDEDSQTRQIKRAS